GSQYWKRPNKPMPVMSSREHLEITLPAALRNSSAKKIARRILYTAWSERHKVDFRLTRDYLYLDPSDVITLQLDDGRELDTRITDMNQGANYEIEMSGVANYIGSYEHDAVADEDGGSVPQPETESVLARAMLFNIPLLSDSHEDGVEALTYYWGAAAEGTGFRFGVLQSQFEDTGWETEGVTTLDA